MFTWLKNLFTNPKSIIKTAINSLDLLVPTLALEITRIEATFNSKTPTEKAQWLVDKVQSFLMRRFGITESV